ncbi:hypothetical protein SAMN05192533_105122 [Mesobacillus persicus]|uniref:Uncharacterized protein n=1 Tax=Mesobacillus persicus TaxID=930146 RepID=A0A1H8ATK5_9BACI|nr:hypothetical protein [Mesobacillus persicus]SEM73138.1 hypothetical protein SAMN05192533_105122 [Mesobacillus persicus]
MRKYWKFMSILVVIILSIGTFYVKSVTSEANHPEFVIDTQSGDAKEIEPLKLVGYYSDTSSMDYTSTDVKISSEGSTYERRSFLDQIIGEPPAVIKEYQEKYRSFMRGKGLNVNSFFENNQFLAYADVDYKTDSFHSHDFKFPISILNKEDASVQSFTVDIPDSENMDYAYMEDLQIIEDELYIITNNMIRNPEGSFDEKHVYTIDLANQTLSNDDTFSQVPEGQEGNHIVAQVIRTSPTEANDHMILLQKEIKVIHDPESYREEVVKQEVISYNLATKEKESISVSDLPFNSELSFFDGSTIYFIGIEGQEIFVTPYHLADGQAGEEYRLQLSGEDGHGSAPMTTIKDGKLYLSGQQLTPKLNINAADVIVADVETGDILFKGQITLDDPKAKNQYELYLHEMLVE